MEGGSGKTPPLRSFSFPLFPLPFSSSFSPLLSCFRSFVFSRSIRGELTTILSFFAT